MSKTNVKIDIPSDNADDLISLATKVEARTLEMATNSPINGLNITALSAALKSAKEKRAQAKRLHEQAEALNQQAYLDLGIARTQNSKTPGTVLNIVTSARDILLGLNRGQEEKLSEWGFKVVSGNSSVKTEK